MILKKLEMDNFLPYYNHHEIDFSPRDNKKIILLKGQNGSGKSSTFTALTFVFFGLGERGALTNADGDSVVASKLVNTKRMREGDGVATVTVHFDHDAVSWTISRKIKFKKLEMADWNTASAADPNLTRKEYAEKLSQEKDSKCSIPSDNFIVTKDGATQTWDNDPTRRARQQKILIESVIPEQSNKYYFFSGEQIKKYTTVPPKDSIQTAVEKILGVKMLDNAIDDLRELILDRYDPAIRRLGRAGAQSQSHAQLADQALSDIAYQERARTTKLLEITNLKKNKEDCESELRVYHDVEQKINELDQAKSSLKDAVDGIEEENAALTTYFSNDYPLLLTVSLLNKIQDVTSTLSPQLPFISQAAKHWLDKNICQCDRPLDDAAKGKLEELVRPPNQSLDHFTECSSLVLGTYGESGLKQKWADHLRKLSTHQSAKDSLTRSIADINQEIDVDTQNLGAEISQTRQDHSNAVAQLIVEEGNLVRIETLLAIHRTTYNEELHKAQTSNVNIDMQKLAAYKQRAEQMIQSFENAKEIIVRTQKANIERLASDSLAAMARPEMGVSGISLDDKYTIMVLDTLGEARYTDDSPGFSAGEKMIIAMSFVLALTRFAGHERPTFIDTPAAKLDPEYTTAIARRLIQQSEHSQIIILYQPGELNPEALQLYVENAARLYEYTKLSKEHSDVTEEVA